MISVNYSHTMIELIFVTEEKVIVAIGGAGAGTSSFGRLLAEKGVYPASCDLTTNNGRASVVKQHFRLGRNKIPVVYLDTLGTVLILMYYVDFSPNFRQQSRLKDWFLSNSFQVLEEKMI